MVCYTVVCVANFLVTAVASLLVVLSTPTAESNPHEWEPASDPTLCSRADLWVDFAKIGWNSFIAYPSTANLYQCVGACRFPLDGTGVNYTRHASTQSLMAVWEPFSALSSCCVPIRLAPLSALFYREGGGVEVIHWPDMVAAECGCR